MISNLNIRFSLLTKNIRHAIFGFTRWAI